MDTLNELQIDLVDWIRENWYNLYQNDFPVVVALEDDLRAAGISDEDVIDDTCVDAQSMYDNEVYWFEKDFLRK